MPPLRFEKILIADERYESAGVFDVTNNGKLDIVSGAYWYPAPKFDRKNKVGPCMTSGEYFDDFSTIPMDVNGDGYMDFVTGGWWGDTLRWRRNPGPAGGQWTDADEYAARQDALAALVLGLLRRCRVQVHLGLSELGEQGNEQRGPLLQAIQRVLRSA